jgi:RND family efflux transporter MFP subunit
MAEQTQIPVEAEISPSHDGEGAPVLPAIAARTGLLAALVLLGIFVILGLVGILPRLHNTAALAKETRELATPTVQAAPPQPGAPMQEFSLPGNVTPYTDSDIRARTSGYLTRWYYDLGAHVKKGALLALISAPEVDHQLAEADADLVQAEATANNAHSLSERYSGLVQTNAVAKQDADTFRNQANATAAAVKSNQANVRRLRDLQSYEKIYAPFDGVITARNTDIGQLVDANSTRALFHMQAIQTLRVYVNIPELYSHSVKIGQTIDLTFAEQPGKIIPGKLVRTAVALDPASRTLLAELVVDNRSGEVLPGALAQAHFRLPVAGPSLIVPVTSLIFRSEGLRLALVHGDTVHLVPIVIGRDDGQTVQVVSGLAATDQVVMNPPDSIIEGEKVRLAKFARGGR